MDSTMMATVLLQLFVLFAMAKIAGYLCEKVHIPAVIGEILVGVLIFNLFIGGQRFYDILGLGSDREVFDVLAELGVIFLLFAVGLETPFSELRKVGKLATTVAVLGVITPFVCGMALMLGLGYGMNESLFVAAALVATSVGITARVIRDMDLTHTIEARVIIGAAVIDDILGMIVLTMVIGATSGGSTDIIQTIIVAGLGVAFVLLVIFVGGLMIPKARQKRQSKKKMEAKVCTAAPRKKHISPLPLALVVCFGLSFAASYFGLAAIIGAFLAGMCFAEFRDRWPCQESFEPINEFLVPFFFIFVGIMVDLSQFGKVIIIALIITVLAIATKFVGCGLGSLKLGKKSAVIVGVGMIPRGEVGIIIASIGLASGLISIGMYAVVVFMSMATTVVAPFLLTYTFRKKLGKKCELPPDTS
ncbi:MAG: cation:proton antiporter [Methanomassiliicoccales archaeon]